MRTRSSRVTDTKGAYITDYDGCHYAYGKNLEEACLNFTKKREKR